MSPMRNPLPEKPLPEKEEAPANQPLDIQGMNKRSKRFLWISMVVGVVLGGAGFIYKVVEFMLTISSPDSKGFADVPVVVYFCVAAGWLCLLVWCFATGKFKNNEQAKLDMLRMEEEYEQLGI
ncbi:MAG: hypothetical protein KC731_12845 [Myxococcales bacterium]|nr:hypothetical protein [Myxococcales bacterium]